MKIALLFLVGTSFLIWRFVGWVNRHGLVESGTGEWYLAADGWYMFVYIWPAYIILPALGWILWVWKDMQKKSIRKEVVEQIREEERQRLKSDIEAAERMAAWAQEEIKKAQMAQEEARQKVRGVEQAADYEIAQMADTIRKLESEVKRQRQELGDIRRKARGALSSFAAELHL